MLNEDIGSALSTSCYEMQSSKQQLLQNRDVIEKKPEEEANLQARQEAAVFLAGEREMRVKGDESK